MPLICSVRSAHGVMKLRIPTVVGLGFLLWFCLLILLFLCWVFCSFDLGCFSPLRYKTAGADLPMKLKRFLWCDICSWSSHDMWVSTFSLGQKKSATFQNRNRASKKTNYLLTIAVSSYSQKFPYATSKNSLYQSDSTFCCTKSDCPINCKEETQRVFCYPLLHLNPVVTVCSFHIIKQKFSKVIGRNWSIREKIYKPTRKLKQYSWIRKDECSDGLSELWVLVTSGFCAEADVRAAKCEIFCSSTLILMIV